MKVVLKNLNSGLISGSEAKRNLLSCCDRERLKAVSRLDQKVQTLRCFILLSLFKALRLKVFHLSFPGSIQEA
jgi:hypothetical protein